MKRGWHCQASVKFVHDPCIYITAVSSFIRALTLGGRTKSCAFCMAWQAQDFCSMFYLGTLVDSIIITHRQRHGMMGQRPVLQGVWVSYLPLPHLHMICSIQMHVSDIHRASCLGIKGSRRLCCGAQGRLCEPLRAKTAIYSGQTFRLLGRPACEI